METSSTKDSIKIYKIEYDEHNEQQWLKPLLAAFSCLNLRIIQKNNYIYFSCNESQLQAIQLTFPYITFIETYLVQN